VNYSSSFLQYSVSYQTWNSSAKNILFCDRHIFCIKDQANAKLFHFGMRVSWQSDFQSSKVNKIKSWKLNEITKIQIIFFNLYFRQLLFLPIIGNWQPKIGGRGIRSKVLRQTHSECLITHEAIKANRNREGVRRLNFTWGC